MGSFLHYNRYQTNFARRKQRFFLAKKMKEIMNLDKLRHSGAHLLAAAVLELYPDAKPTIGPSTEEGFYYDFDFGDVQISENDLIAIEKKMRFLVKNWGKFERQEVDERQALEQFKNNEYKKELISEFAKNGDQLTFYKSGNFLDLCRGGHVEKPAAELKFFKLMSVAGAYWRGSEKKQNAYQNLWHCF